MTKTGEVSQPRQEQSRRHLWVVDLNASVNDLASYCPLANIKLTVMSPGGKG